jgi:hypothetical protein
VSYNGTAGSAKRLTQAATFTSLPKVASAFRNEGPQVFTALRRDGGSTIGAAEAVTAAATATATATASMAGGGASRNRVSAGYNGLSDLNSDNLNGFEPINVAERET